MTQQQPNQLDLEHESLDELIEEYGEEVLAGASVPTRCPEHCFVEPDGACPHGYVSVLVEAGLV